MSCTGRTYVSCWGGGTAGTVATATVAATAITSTAVSTSSISTSTLATACEPASLAAAVPTAIPTAVATSFAAASLAATGDVVVGGGTAGDATGDATGPAAGPAAGPAGDATGDGKTPAPDLPLERKGGGGLSPKRSALSSQWVMGGGEGCPHGGGEEAWEAWGAGKSASVTAGDDVAAS